MARECMQRSNGYLSTLWANWKWEEEPPVTSCSPLASNVRQTLTSMTKILTSSITEFFFMQQQVSQGNLLGGTLVKFCQEFFSKSIILKEGKLNWIFLAFSSSQFVQSLANNSKSIDLIDKLAFWPFKPSGSWCHVVLWLICLQFGTSSLSPLTKQV
jgi:hypothetical protein